MKILKLILVFSMVLILLSCSGKSEENDKLAPVSDIPSLSIEKLEPAVISQFESISFEIKFTDGDGDMGTEDPDDHSLFILDTRDSILYSYHIPPQSPVENVSITGVFLVEIENVILLDQSNTSETVVFDVSIKDRADNYSKIVKSIPVTVNK